MHSFQAHYKQVKSTRGFSYRYYFSAPAPGQPTVLFIHGFPSLAIEWHNQVAYFQEKGYGIVAPDMLGYGGTDRPEEAAAYVHTGLAKDLIGILDHEKVSNVFAVGHDWGAKTTSVLAQLYSDRFLGFAFLAAGYLPPNTLHEYEELNKLVTQALGYESLGYWEFFTAPDANEVIMKHLDSFWDIVHAKDPDAWKANLCATGGLRVFLESDSKIPRLSQVPEELRAAYHEEFSESKGGFKGSLNYYRVAVSLDLEDAKQIPLSSYKVEKPVFFGATANDVICAPAFGQANIDRFCPHATVEVFNAGHWVTVETSEEINLALDKWITGVIA